MPKPPKLHLNENLSPRLASQLRQFGFDVTSTVEMNMIGAPDVEQLAFAASAERAIVTFNHRDFVPLHEQFLAEGTVHWGIVLSTEETVDVLRRRLLRLLNTLASDELKSQIRWLNEFR